MKKGIKHKLKLRINNTFWYDWGILFREENVTGKEGGFEISFKKTFINQY